MPIEQRVISGARPRPQAGGKIGAKEPEPEAPAKKPVGLKKPLLVLGAVAVVGGGAYAAFALGLVGGGDGAEAAPEAPVPGEVLAVEPISVNLADGHYLRLGMGLQLTEDVHEAPDPSRALDIAIATFSGRTVAEVADPATRDALKDQLATALDEAYEGEVMDVYLTNYVTQ